MSRAVLLIVVCGCRTPATGLVPVVEDDSDGPHTGIIGQDDTAFVDEDACFSEDQPWLHTSSGCVLGQTTPDGESFLGIPYAEPPTGDLRFLPPQPALPWSGRLDAEAVGSPCLQTFDSRDGALHDGEGDEDCLTLNVWRPEDAEDLPVVFYVHGGGFVNGSGGVPDLALNPTLAHDAVVVTHNARLGPLGFLAHPGLDALSKQGVSGNQGVQDTLLALRWVNDNLEALGADPDRVILVGQEAGGLVACTLLFSPLAEDLFDGVILQSAPCGLLDLPLTDRDPRTTELVSAEDVGQELADALLCGGSDEEQLSCLQEISSSRLMAALEAREAPYVNGVRWEPTVDGYVLPDTPIHLMQAGALRQVPIIAGVNADEGTLYATATSATTVDEVAFPFRAGKVVALAGADAGELPADVYTEEAFGSWPAAFMAFYADFVRNCPTRSFLRAASELNPEVYAYTFTHTPSFTVPELGAFTGAEVPFLFGTREDEYVDGEALIGAWIQSAWLWSQDPEPHVVGVGAWPDLSGDLWVEFGDDTEPELSEDPYAERCAPIDAMGWQVY